MPNRIILNNVSYHGKGAIQAIPDEVRARGFKKAFVCSDPDLVKFNVTKKVTDLLDANNLEYVIYSNIKRETKTYRQLLEIETRGDSHWSIDHQ